MAVTPYKSNCIFFCLKGQKRFTKKWLFLKKPKAFMDLLDSKIGLVICQVFNKLQKRNIKS